MTDRKQDLRGTLHLPPAGEMNFSDLISSFVSFLGIPDIGESLRGGELLGEINPGESIVFVFADGLGSCFLSRLPESAFLNRNKVRDLYSVFPSTTPCAMFNCATGLEPALHGIPGRWTYLRQHDAQIITFTISERFFGDIRNQEEYPMEEVWQTPSIYTRTDKDVVFVIPGIWTDSVFEKYLCGTNRVGKYSSVGNAVDLILDTMSGSAPPAFSFLYLVELDELLHKTGTDNPGVDSLLATINGEMERLAASLPPGVRLCISADHGQITIPPDKRIAIRGRDPIIDLLETSPYGEPRVPHFSVKKGREDEFRSLFTRRYGDLFHIFSREEASEARVFGRSELSERAKELYGNFIAVAKEGHTLRFYPDRFGPESDNLGDHGGTYPEEITVPLILA